MRLHERSAAFWRSPSLLWDVLGRGRYRFNYDQMPITVDRMSLRKRLNLLRAAANIGYRRARPWAMPLHMQLELTNYCNLRCPVCPTGIRAVERKPQPMAPELFERVWDEVGPYLLTASLWGWGEPNLHPRLAAMLRIARRHRVSTMLSTNGQNLDDDDVIRAIFDAPPTFLIVAIDGLTDETNQEFRVRSRLEPALEGVRRLAELKARHGQSLPVLHMRFIIMRHNEHEVPALADFAREHRFDLLTVRSLATVDSDAAVATHSDMVPAEAGYRAFGYADQERVRRDDFYCTNPFWFPSIYADGTVVACEQDHSARLPMGVVSDTTSFRDVWYSEQARDARRRTRDRPSELSFCNNCSLRDRPITDVSIGAQFIQPVDYDRLLEAGTAGGTRDVEPETAPGHTGDRRAG
jgi:MoaA/NifB/PqqE/SkfB family radical SAM enzyme